MHLRPGAGRRVTSRKLDLASAAVDIEQAGHSSASRASDCRQVQLSYGPWFDSGRPDFCSDSFPSIVVKVIDTRVHPDLSQGPDDRQSDAGDALDFAF